jgi:hypothetical protein
MDVVKVYLELGEKKVFAGALDWPGWCRSGKTEEAALQALVDHGPRYAEVLKGTGIKFQLPGGSSDLKVVERLPGDATTDFGAPGAIPEADKAAFEKAEYERSIWILDACWKAFDRAAEQAEGKELRKGPRGGGRDLEKIVEHVLGGNQGYLSRITWTHKQEEAEEQNQALLRAREANRMALEMALKEGLPEKGPRGGLIWPVRYFVRRAAWHILDHAWEIEDRIE